MGISTRKLMEIYESMNIEISTATVNKLIFSEEKNNIKYNPRIPEKLYMG